MTSQIVNQLLISWLVSPILLCSTFVYHYLQILIDAAELTEHNLLDCAHTCKEISFLSVNHEKQIDVAQINEGKVPMLDFSKQLSNWQEFAMVQSRPMIQERKASLETPTILSTMLFD